MTLRDLASRLGLGKSTVQRALAGSALVGEQTRKRVLAEAETCGYRHDPYFSALAARRLRGSHTAGSGLLLHYFHSEQEALVEKVGIDLSEELLRLGETMGFDVQRVILPQQRNVERIPEMLWHQGSVGFILGHTDARLQNAVANFGKVPVLCCQRQDQQLFNTVRFAINDSMRMAWRRLWDVGARRIGCAVMRHEPEIDDDRDRLGAALALLAEHPIQGIPVPPLRCNMEDHGAYLAWLRKEQPDGVICFRPGFWFLHQNSGFNAAPFVTLNASKVPELQHVPGVLRQHGLLAKQLLIRMDSMIRHGDLGKPKVAVHTVISPEWWDGA